MTQSMLVAKASSFISNCLDGDFQMGQNIVKELKLDQKQKQPFKRLIDFIKKSKQQSKDSQESIKLLQQKQKKYGTIIRQLQKTIANYQQLFKMLYSNKFQQVTKLAESFDKPRTQVYTVNELCSAYNQIQSILSGKKQQQSIAYQNNSIKKTLQRIRELNDKQGKNIKSQTSNQIKKIFNLFENLDLIPTTKIQVNNYYEYFRKFCESVFQFLFNIQSKLNNWIQNKGLKNTMQQKTFSQKITKMAQIVQKHIVYQQKDQPNLKNQKQLKQDIINQYKTIDKLKLQIQKVKVSKKHQIAQCKLKIQQQLARLYNLENQYKSQVKTLQLQNQNFKEYISDLFLTTGVIRFINDHRKTYKQLQQIQINFQQKDIKILLNDQHKLREICKLMESVINIMMEIIKNKKQTLAINKSKQANTEIQNLKKQNQQKLEKLEKQLSDLIKSNQKIQKQHKDQIERYKLIIYNILDNLQNLFLKTGVQNLQYQNKIKKISIIQSIKMLKQKFDQVQLQNTFQFLQNTINKLISITNASNKHDNSIQNKMLITAFLENMKQFLNLDKIPEFDDIKLIITNLKKKQSQLDLVNEQYNNLQNVCNAVFQKKIKKPSSKQQKKQFLSLLQKQIQSIKQKNYQFDIFIQQLKYINKFQIHEIPKINSNDIIQVINYNYRKFNEKINKNKQQLKNIKILLNSNPKTQYQSTQDLLKITQQYILYANQQLRKNYTLIKNKSQPEVKFQLSCIPLIFKTTERLYQQIYQWKNKQQFLALFSESKRFKLFHGDILCDQTNKQSDDQKIYLINQINSLIKKQIKSTKLLYKYDKLNSTNIHQYIDDIQNILLIIKTKKGQIVGGFSKKSFSSKRQEQILQEKLSQQDEGFLFSLTTKQIYFLKKNNPKAMSITYDPYFVIFGNCQLKIKSMQHILQSNFGCESSFFEASYNNKRNFLSKEQNKYQVQMETFEFHQIIYNK